MMVEIKNLSYRFGNKVVLDGIDAQFREGEFIVLAGKNGAGKSTFLRCLMGILSPYSGSVRLDEKLSRKRVGFISDRLSFFEDLSVKEAVALHCRIYSTLGFDDSLLKQLDIPRERKVKELSLGERTILLFSMIVAQEPQLLLLDEIIHALDPFIRDVFLENLLDMIHQFGTTVIAVNHTFSEIERIPDRILVMEGGKFVLDQNTDRLKETFKKVEMRGGEPLPDSIPVVFEKDSSFFQEYYIYPFAPEMRTQLDAEFQDVKLEEIMKAFIGGYYVKKRNK